VPARGALTLFHVRGIRIGVDYSWFVVLFLVILWLSGFYKSVLGEADDSVAPYVLALGSAIAFFGSVLLHELGHAFVAMRNGIGITDITLWMFGGIARLSRDSDSAGVEFRIAIAGPLVTLAIAAACAAGGIAAAGAGDFADAMLVREDAVIPGALALVAWVAGINLLILVFNLIPAYPLDGGRIARAAAWRLTGDRNRATKFAARVGQGFSYLFIAIGLLLLVNGDVIGGIWLAIIGFILGSSARGAVVQTELQSRLQGLTIADVMDTEPVAIPGDATVAQALDEYFLRYRWPWFPVTDGAQHFLGLIERGAADAVAEPAASTVSEVFEPDASGNLQVLADAPLEAALGNDALRRLGAIAAVDQEGRLRGVLTAQGVGRALRDIQQDRADTISP
jgi:Zn-dependent protease